MDWEVAATRGLLRLDCVLCETDARTPLDVFELAASALGEALGIDAAALVRRLCAREARGSTAIGGGIAVPRADAWGMSRPHAAFVRSTHPLEFFQAIDAMPVHDVLVLVAPRPATQVYGEMLQHYQQLMRTPAFREGLAAAARPELVWNLFRDHEWSREARPFAPLTGSLRKMGPTKGIS